MFGVALLTSALLAVADGRIYERCELARDLLSLGIKKEHIPTWVCIAFHESRFDTTARNPYSGDHGLLQISELYWCGAGKACGVPCSALRDDDISDDIECALRVHEEHTRLQGDGFLAWVVYPQHCRHNAKKYLADCENSVKTSSVRTNERARVLKSQNHVSTNFTFHPKIDDLLPPYLVINSLLSGNYEKQFEQNYNKNERFNWINYKIHNIDDLKLPVFNQKDRSGKAFSSDMMLLPTRTTTQPTTTTTEWNLRNIKPPSPRRIESNLFRKKIMRPSNEAVKSSETLNISKVISKPLSTTAEARTFYIPMTESYQNDTSNISTYLLSRRTSTSTPTTTPSSSTTTTQTTTKDDKLHLTFTSAAARTTTQKTKSSFSHTRNNVQSKLQTTILPISHSTSAVTTTLRTTKLPTSNMDQTTVATDVNQKTTDDKLNAVRETPYQSVTSSKPADQRHTIKPINSSSIIDKKLTTLIFDVNTDKSAKSSKMYLSRNTQPSDSSKISIVNIGSVSIERSKSESSSIYTSRSRSRTTLKSSEEEKFSTTTSKPSTRSWRTAKSGSDSLSDKLCNKNSSTIPADNQPTTATLRSKDHVFLPQLLHGSKNTTSSARNNYVQPTSPVPRATLLTPTSATTAVSFTKTNLIAAPTTPRPTTTRSTQSIFDLYLKPTQRPKFSISPFKSNGFSFRIFSGGTTTHSPSYKASEDSKVPPGNVEQNKIIRKP